MSPKKLGDMKPEEKEPPQDKVTPVVERPISPPPSGVETMLPLDGNRFDSESFAIYIGSQGQRLTAHETILSQSPYLRGKCTRGRQAKKIYLPEDDIKIFRPVPEYLYGRTFNPTIFGTGHELARGLAKVYILGCKYWMGSLTAFIVNHFQDMDFLESDPSLLMHIASMIYSQTPPADRAFKEFFVPALVKCHQKAKHRVSKPKVREYIQRGGELASGIHEAQETYSALLDAQKGKGREQDRPQSRRDRNRPRYWRDDQEGQMGGGPSDGQRSQAEGSGDGSGRNSSSTASV